MTRHVDTRVKRGSTPREHVPRFYLRVLADGNGIILLLKLRKSINIGPEN